VKPLFALVLLVIACSAAENHRGFKNDADSKFWLENMLGYHRFSADEVQAATGLGAKEVNDAINRLGVETNVSFFKDRLTVLPYPGGRHPRIGFLEGAVEPQRETKISIFLPWDSSSYIVADVPEAIWSNLGLTYLAHTHVPTIWSKQNIELPRLEWQRGTNGILKMERELPNGIAFGTEVTPGKYGVRIREWLRNGTKEKLTDLRVQNCVMLKGAMGFTEQTNTNKILEAPYCAAMSSDGKRWIITAWAPIHRAWANPPVPCIHADPKFPDCAPSQTVETRGWISFYEGEDVRAEFRRLDSLKWQ
jgi:hypothetical protein